MESPEHDLERAVVKAIARLVGRQEEELTPEQLLNDFHVSQPYILKVILKHILKERFGIGITNRAWKRWKAIGDILAYVRPRRSVQG